MRPDPVAVVARCSRIGASRLFALAVPAVATLVAAATAHARELTLDEPGATRRVEGVDPGPLGKLWNPLYFRRGGYAIHGSTSVPPVPASHGCVRVPLWVAERLFERVPHGEVVYVY